MGLAPGTLVTSFNPTAGSSSQVSLTTWIVSSWQRIDQGNPQVVPSAQQQQMAADNLYRDANSMLYGDSKPSEDDIDRVVGKINQEYAPFSFASWTTT